MSPSAEARNATRDVLNYEIWKPKNNKRKSALVLLPSVLMFLVEAFNVTSVRSYLWKNLPVEEAFSDMKFCKSMI